MKRYLYGAAVAVLLMNGCLSAPNRGVTIEGDISSLDAGEMISCVGQTDAAQDDAEGKTLTTTAEAGGKFILHIPIKLGRADWYTLWVGSSASPGKTVRLYLDSGVIQIKGEGFADAIFAGNKDVTEYNEFKAGLNKVDSLISIDPVLNKQMGNLKFDFIKEWIEKHPASAMGTALLEQARAGGLQRDSVISIFGRRNPGALNNLPAQRLKDWMRTNLDVAIGKKAPEFILPDTSGKQISLKDFKGKYVLIDFWAGWCSPCRAENPNLVRAYNHYKSKNFTVLGVSLDKPAEKASWLAAIHKDGLTWTNISDLKFFDSPVAKLYHLQSIPANFLIDPNGVIIARDLRGSFLMKKLAEVLSDK